MKRLVLDEDVQFLERRDPVSPTERARRLRALVEALRRALKGLP